MKTGQKDITLATYSNSNAYILYSIAILIGLNNIIIGYKIFGMSIDRIFEVIIFFLLIKKFTKDFQNKGLLFVELIIFSFIILVIFKNFSLLLQGEDLSFSSILREVLRVIITGIYLYLGYYLIRGDISKLNIILLIQFCAFLFAFFQSPLTPLTELSQSIRLTYFGVNLTEAGLEHYENFLNDTNRHFMRLSGPYGSTITLSYSLVTSAILATYLYIKTYKSIYLYFLIFLLLIGVMSLTRSATLSIVVLLIYLLIKKGKKYLFPFLFLLAIYSVYNFYLSQNIDLENYSRIISLDEQSAQGKIPLMITGIYTVLTNPFGITEVAYTEVKQYMYTIFKTEEVLNYTAHNGIINLGFGYTILGYFVFFYFLYILVKLSTNLQKEQKTFWKVAVIAYLAQQSFHNNGLFTGDFNILLVLSLYLYETYEGKIAKKYS